MRPLIQLARKLLHEPDSKDAILKNFVATHQFPMISEGRATFFFWDGDEADAVYFVNWVYGLESSQAFKRIPHTNAFWLSVDLPRAARVEYKFEVQRNGNSYWMRDPLNSERAFDPFGSNSVCAMTDYVFPEWANRHSATRKGRIEQFTLSSKVWTDDRTITMYLPNEHRPSKNYPLLICHDGHDYRKYASMIEILDNLIHRQEVIPLIVAFTDGVNRNPEYGANPRQAQFIVEEILPAVEARYNIADGPENRGIMGASFGGVSSLYAAWKYPEVFQKILVQSGSFAFTDIGEHNRGPLWDPVVEFVNALRDDLSMMEGRMFMSCGTFESLIYFNRSLAPLIRQNRDIDLLYLESQDGHNWINWRDSLRQGLSWIFPGHLWMYYE